MSDHAEQTKALIEERLAAATPGPWVADRNLPFSNELVGIFAPDAHEYVMRVDPDEPPRPADAEFIANAPTDIAFLLAALSASEAEVTRLETGIAEAEHVHVFGADTRPAPDRTDGAYDEHWRVRDVTLGAWREVTWAEWSALHDAEPMITEVRQFRNVLRNLSKPITDTNGAHA